MANKHEDEQERLLREKRELLKLKQGIIEESDIVEVEKHQEKIELHGWKKVENFFYHYKWRVVGITLTVLFFGFMLIQTITKERYDLYVLAITTSYESGMYTKTDDLELALEKYCPDYDGNGYVHVSINYINLGGSMAAVQYDDAENYKFSAELSTGDSQLFICDDGIIAKIDAMNDEIQFFELFTEKYPDNTRNDGECIQLNTTALKEDARWSTCPDTIGLYVRGEYEHMLGNNKEAKEQRRRANEVIENIMTGNVINPEKTDQADK